MYFGVYCIINDLDKKVMICHTTNLDKSIQSIYEGIKSIPQVITDLKSNNARIMPLEHIGYLPSVLLRIQYWIAYYAQLGYSFYNKPRELHYRLYHRIKSTSNDDVFSYRVYLFIKSMRNEILIGVFDSIKEKDEFIEKYYKNGIEYVVFANTDQTRKCHK
jgi:hypothetical protein